MDKKVAIFGATGYVGLIFVNRLLSVGWNLKLFVRNKRRLEHLSSCENLESSELEICSENIDNIADELRECDVIYYFIHSMSDPNMIFDRVDCDLASHVGEAAAKANIKQIIYLGGLGVEKENMPLSMHLRSRHEVANTLSSSGVNVTEIRCGIIIGAGSASFEIIGSLATKLPFIPKLPYTDGMCQSIDIDDVITYLLYVYDNELYFNRIIEVGCDDKLTYVEMLQVYAKLFAGRTLHVVYIPLLSYFLKKKHLAKIVSFLSAIPYSLAKPLIDGVDSYAIIGKYPTNKIEKSYMPCLSYEESVRKALQGELDGRTQSHWSVPLKHKILSHTKEKFLHVDNEELRVGFLKEYRERIISNEDVDAVFKECLSIGGKHGYWSPLWMWQTRAFLDKLVDGTGMESGRISKNIKPRLGENIDFWIVSDYLDEENLKVFTLKARLKSPGDSWLQFAIVKIDEHKSKFLLRAYFKPWGVSGYMYWYSLWLIHKYIFTVMINNIIKEAKKI